MSKQTIQCLTLAQFMSVIQDLVERRIGFDAHADSLIIELNGSF